MDQELLVGVLLIIVGLAVGLIAVALVLNRRAAREEQSADSPVPGEAADDSAAEGAKAEGATAEAVASSSDPVMGAVEQIMKEQMAKGLGIDPTALTSGNLDQVALAAMIRSKINEPAPAPTT